MTTNRAECEWMELFAELMRAPLIELPAKSLARQLIRTFDGIACAFWTRHAGGQPMGEIFHRDQQTCGQRANVDEPDGSKGCQPPRVPLQRGASGRGRLIQLAEGPVRFVVGGPDSIWYAPGDLLGCSDQLSLPLPSSGSELRLEPMPTDEQRSFTLARNERFSGHELDFAWRIWRVLTGLDRQIRALASCRPDPAVASELGITQRELAVLGLAADGLTAAAIGRRLAIRERTVRKHLEHAYAKLKVTNRVSAVLRARQAGVLPLAPSP